MFHLSFEIFLIGCAVLLLLALISSKTSSRLGVPVLLSFLCVGMIAGSDGIGKIYFDNAQFAQHLGVVALLYILFSGGLETAYQDIRPIFRPGLVLSTVAVVLSAGFVGLIAWKLFNMPFLESMLLGSIMSSTDAAAVFSILRSRHISIKPNLRSLLEFESGSNDPTAVILVTVCIALLQQTQAHPLLSAIGYFVAQMGIGLALGFLAGKAMIWILNHVRYEQDALYPLTSMALVLLTYGVTASLGGSGFLAAYLAGLIVGNAEVVRKRTIRKFHDVGAWLMQIIMFVTLGLLVFPSQLPGIAGEGLIISLALMFVARPLSVFISLLFTAMPFKEKLFVSWVGLRGATPVILATFPFVAGIPMATTLFNIVFFVVITSVLFQGTTIAGLAKYLGLALPEKRHGHIPIEVEHAENMNSDLFEVVVPPQSALVGKEIRQIVFPVPTLVVLLNKGEGHYVMARGETLIDAHDRLLLLTEKIQKNKIKQFIKA